ncbi:S-layer homology domain-containing protein, partial [Sinanaerobacter chloroacetimidivorans]
ISGNTLSAANAGTVTVTATITDGTAVGTNYKKDFTIAVSAAFIPVTGISGVPTTATVGKDLTLSGAVAPAGATNQTIVWSVKDAGTTGATISGNSLYAISEDTVVITATIINGKAVGTNYSEDFTITVSMEPPADKILLSIVAPTAITGLTNGTAKTAAALGLPSTVTLVTDNGNVGANVTWDVDSCAYIRSLTEAQTFTVNGTVILPAGVVNTNGVNLTSSINVTVNMASGSSGGSGGSGGSSGGGGSTPAPADNNPVAITKYGDTTTAVQTVSATTGLNGVATASVTKEQIANMVKAVDDKATDQKAQTALQIKVDSDSAATGISVVIPQGAASMLTNGVSSLTISSPIVTVTFDDKALAAINKNTNGDITVTARKPANTALSDEDKAIIGNKPVYDLKVSSGSTSISTFGGGTAKVSIPYKPAAGEDINKIVVYYISNSGKLNMVPGCVYDASTRTVTFRTTHFSSYAIAYNDVSFSDVSGWYVDYVSYLAARGILSGAGDGKFVPGKNITRAEFIAILAKLSDNDLSGYTTSSFSDIAANAWYSAEVQWAYENGITSGYNDNFYPQAAITREQMAAMLYHYAKYAGMDVSGDEGTSDREFSDAASISNWAVSPVRWAVNSGIVSGNSIGTFAPKAYATKAQAAKMIAILLQNTIK